MAPIGNGEIKTVRRRARVQLPVIFTMVNKLFSANVFLYLEIRGFWQFLGWIDITWDHGTANSYRWGAEGKFDLAMAPSQNAEAARIAITAMAEGRTRISPNVNLRTSRPLPVSLHVGGGRGGKQKMPSSVLISKKSMSTTNLFDVSFMDNKFKV